MASLDFIQGLPRLGHANCILAVVDKFSKYTDFLPLLHPFTASKVAQLFMASIYKLHGIPEAQLFKSSFSQELFKLAGMSSSYHAQTDSQTERVNQCLETYLRCFVHSCPHKRHLWLSMAEFWYTTSFHSALGRSPFEVLYGRPPRYFGITPQDAVTNIDLSIWLSNRDLMLRTTSKIISSVPNTG